MIVGLTGGIGSGETSEGFGPNYSLPNSAYCESCSNCGERKLPHRACKKCGEYKGRAVIAGKNAE